MCTHSGTPCKFDFNVHLDQFHVQVHVHVGWRPCTEVILAMIWHKLISINGHRQTASFTTESIAHWTSSNPTNANGHIW